MENKSLGELMAEAYNLSLSLAYLTTAPGGSFLDVREDLPESLDKVWSWADGLMHKYYHDRANGRCSLAATISFDVAEFEKEVSEDIETFKQALTTLPPCRELTFDEMKARGYRGSWAGYTPEQDRLYYLEQAREGLKKAQTWSEKTYDESYHKEREIRYQTQQIKILGLPHACQN